MKYEEYKTTCCYCGVGCGIIVKKDRRGHIEVEGDADHPVNKGMLCSKGMNLHYTVENRSDRLRYPEMRGSRHHPRTRVDWDTALERAAAVFKSIIQKYGPDSVGFYVSGQFLTEEYYLVNKLSKGFLGTNNIDTNSRLCMSSAVVGYMNTFGEDSVPISYNDIEEGSCFLIAGANPAWCHPILFRRLEKHKEANPLFPIIVVDPRRTQTCAIADLHLQIRPGTDVILYNAIARRIYDTKMYDKKFIERHTENFDKYLSVITKFSVRKAAEICGIKTSKIAKAAEYIGRSQNYMSMWAMGLNQSAIGVDKNYALINLHLLTGQLGRPGTGPFSLTGQPNAMGGREVGGMANLLAAHKVLANPQHRKEVADFWGVEDISPKPGLTATKMFEALAEGKMKAIWIACTNPAVSMPNSKLIEEALQKARFVVVQDISAYSDTLAYADLVLPAAGWGEKCGTMTNSDRRISYLPKILDAPGEALPDAEILWRFAQKMNFEGFDYNDVSEVYDEYVRLTKNTHIDISGLNHQRLKKEGTFQYPVPYDDHPGTPRLFEDYKFYTPSQKAKFNVPENLFNLSEQPNEEYPYILTTGRIRDQWHTMTRTRKVNKLLRHIPAPYLEMHPDDAQKQGLAEDDIVLVENPRGKVQVKLKCSANIKPGVVFLPMHWGKILNNSFARANNLTSSLIDQKSKQPDFKYSTVSIQKYQKPAEKIIIVGAGAAAYRFVKTYRELNEQDAIQVFSREAELFYNRVLLPEYVSEELTWQQLKKIKEGELEKLNIQSHKSISIAQILPQEKKVVDSEGISHSYDKLILATGSRAFLPREVPIHLEGVFTIRNRDNADELKTFLKQSGTPLSDQHVIIVGGGLLGLEVAAALKKKNVNITLIQRASRLMEAQLDIVASKILAEDVIERDISVYFNNEISTIFKNPSTNTLRITLKSGRTLEAQAVIYAIGTRPNIELATASGIDCGRGVVVNQYLQTSDPNIFAIGEIAEFEENRYGITSAAEEQADCAARFISGDLTSLYQGATLMNILKFDDLDLCSIGKVNIAAQDENYEEVVFTDLRKRYYKKCIIKNDRLEGAILLGDKSEFAEFRSLIENKIELSNKRDELLRVQKPKDPIIGKLVCSCNNIGHGNLKQKIDAGLINFDELCKSTGAGLGCGSCKPEVKSILQETLAQLKS